MGPGQISFTPDGTGLVVVVKTFQPPVYLYTFSSGVVGSIPSLTSDYGAVNFAFVFEPSSNDVVLVDANPYGTGSGVIVVDVSPATQTVSFAWPQYYIIPGQSAACWVTYSSATGHYYAANAASGTVSDLILTGDTTFTLNSNITATSFTPTDVNVVTVSGVDYLLVNSGQSIWVFQLGTTGEVNSVSFSRNDGGGNGIASYITTTSDAISFLFSVPLLLFLSLVVL